MRCREDADLEKFIGFLQALKKVWPQVEARLDIPFYRIFPCLNRFLLIWEVDGQNDIWPVCRQVVHTVHQGLVHAENYRFSFYKR